MRTNDAMSLSRAPLRRAAGMGALVLAVSSSVWAAPIQLAASQDQNQVSAFALDFGAMGGVASASISRTDFDLEIDGPAGTARFVSYHQDIEPILLLGQFSTGAIRVEVVPGSSAGTYNRETGEFVTSELYNIHFDGDLSAFGLTSPVTLPSESVGMIDIETMTVGNVTMNWAGASQLENPLDPQVPIDFSYICTLFASFATEAASYIEFAMVDSLSGSTASLGLRSTLLGYLNAALAALADENIRGAISALNAFILKVERAVPAQIEEADALLLATQARTAIFLARTDPAAMPMVRNPSDSMDKQSIEIRD